MEANKQINDFIETLRKSEFYTKALSDVKFESDNTNVHRTLVAMADTSTKPAIIWDNNFRLIYANESFLKSIGYKLSEIIYKKIFEDDGSSSFITKETVKESQEITLTNLANGLEIIPLFKNQWYHKKGYKLNMTWGHGFNDPITKFGSGKVKIKVNIWSFLKNILYEKVS